VPSHPEHKITDSGKRLAGNAMMESQLRVQLSITPNFFRGYTKFPFHSAPDASGGGKPTHYFKERLKIGANQMNSKKNICI